MSLILAALLLAPAEVEEAETSTVVRTEKRANPDLAGRGSESGENPLLWVPRALLLPAHLVLEWGVRKPLGALLTVAERDRWADLLIDFFTFDERRLGIIPTFFLDFNFRPSVGIYAFANEVFVKSHGIRLALGYGGDDWYRVTFVDRWNIGHRSELDFSFNLWARPDHIYTGLGLDGDPDLRSRYFRELMDGKVQLLTRPWQGSELRVEVGVRRNRFRDGDGDEERTLSEGLAAGLFAPPVGFADGYTAAYQQVLVRVDTREERPKEGSGLLVEAYLKHGWDIESPEGRQWMGYGGSTGAFFDLGHRRVIGVTAQAHLVNPVGGREVPFTELFILGVRPQDLSGFLPGTFIGQSAGIVTFEYDYPIWVFLDGSLQVSVGNAFDRNFRDFDPRALRASVGLGLTNTNDRDNALTVLVAVGSSRFDEPFSIDGFRLVLGTQTGF